MRHILIVVFLGILSSYAWSYTCDTSNACGHGFCDTTTQLCKCDSGWVDDRSGTSCSYEQKKQLTAFLLEFFLGATGAGQFYVGNNNLAIGQLWGLLFGGLITTLLGASMGLPMDSSVRIHQSISSAFIALGLSALLADVVWWIIDTIRFGMNKIEDKNGYPLKPW